MSTSRVTSSVTIIDAPYHGRRGVLGTYLVRGEESAVIDPGPASQTGGVLEALRTLGASTVNVVCLTHIHLDHAAGSWMILDQNPEALAHCHPRGVQHMVDPGKIKAAAEEIFKEGIKDYGEIKGVDPDRVKASTDGESLDLGGVELRVIWTPGHTTHSQSYYEPDSRVLIVGDAVGHTPGNLDIFVPASPPPYNPRQAAESLDRLLGLGAETLGVSHFGVFQDAEERLRSFREQVRLWERLAFRAVDEGLDLRGLYGLVEAEDSEAASLVASDPQQRSSVYQSLVGFLSYARWERQQK
ncbi:MAG TPA: MBL fold metallo-hydrolase [Candidatus Desulfaltia sp.]|nr:MBL fold metallo-hydrolase [Candidatus Desulfaltia sp.]